MLAPLGPAAHLHSGLLVREGGDPDAEEQQPLHRPGHRGPGRALALLPEAAPPAAARLGLICE